MKNLPKKIYLIGFISLFIACESILQEDPSSLATADIHYSTAEGIEDGLEASYTPLRSIYGRQEGFFLTVTGTDIFTNGFGGIANPPIGYINDYSEDLTSTYPFVETMWDQFYSGINQTNAVVERAPDVEGLDESNRARIIGEARFLRALYYFHLVQQFGDVHFTLEETEGVETEAERTSETIIYEDGIVPDLEYSIDNLPESSDDYGRVTKPAAEALLARIHLTLENWPEAETLADNVINNYDFQLVEPYANLWNIENDANQEIVWSVQYTDDELTNGEGNWGHLFFIWDYTFNSAMSRDVENGRAWQRFLPTNYLYNLYDRSVDSRWEGSWQTVWFANTEGEINGHSVAPGDTAIKIVMEEVPDEKQESVPYWLIDYKDNWIGSVEEDLEVGSNERRNYPTLLKFKDPLRGSTNEQAGQRDFPVIRLSEMYLIAAEAAWRQGNLAAAADYMNVVRRRAAIEGEEEEMEVIGSDITLDFILEERARELVGEKHRWYDLKRTGTLLDRTREYNLDAAPNIEEMHLVRPIPQSHIDRVDNFPQNEGYD